MQDQQINNPPLDKLDCQSLTSSLLQSIDTSSDNYHEDFSMSVQHQSSATQQWLQVSKVSLSIDQQNDIIHRYFEQRPHLQLYSSDLTIPPGFVTEDVDVFFDELVYHGTHFITVLRPISTFQFYEQEEEPVFPQQPLHCSTLTSGYWNDSRDFVKPPSKRRPSLKHCTQKSDPSLSSIFLPPSFCFYPTTAAKELALNKKRKDPTPNIQSEKRALLSKENF